MRVVIKKYIKSNKDISKEKYENIFKRAYNRTENMLRNHKIKQGNLNTYLKICVLNVYRY